MSYWSRSFPGLAECLAEVRQFTQMVLGDAPGAELVVLAVSELAGNAIVHTASGEPGGQFVVHLAAFTDRWQVRVDDEGAPDDPRIVVSGLSAYADADGGVDGGADADLDLDADVDWAAEAGRGLAMVAAVSQKWGVLGDCRARAVWAEIPYPMINGAAVESVMSGDMLDALAAAAEALADEACEKSEDQDFDAMRDEEDPGSEAECEAAGVPATAGVTEAGGGTGTGDRDGTGDQDRDDVGEGTGERGSPAVPAAPPADRPRKPAEDEQRLPAAAGWPGRMPTDPKVADRYRRAARSAVFQRALLENAYIETIGPRPLPFWPPFPNPLALQGAQTGQAHRDDRELEEQEAG